MDGELLFGVAAVLCTPSPALSSVELPMLADATRARTLRVREDAGPAALPAPERLDALAVAAAIAERAATAG